MHRNRIASPLVRALFARSIDTSKEVCEIRQGVAIIFEFILWGCNPTLLPISNWCCKADALI
jgi:hypothetical protein